ncbi:MAG: lipopolysaccharide heptosyltransferase II [Bacteroidota bacterium]|mgnify:FL=1
MPPQKILVFHTAFIGDIILTLPLVQRLRASLPGTQITFVAIPSAANVLENHPAINRIVVYDKRGTEAGLSGILKLAAELRAEKFDIALIPHRSLRSALVAWLARIPKRVGFSASAAPRLFTDVVQYDKNSHEIDRNLSLLRPLRIAYSGDQLPSVYPSDDDKRVVDKLLNRSGQFIGFAPGSVWNTKRWPKEHFISLGKKLASDGASLVMVGSRQDAALCEEIGFAIGSGGIVNAAGKLSLLQSAELIRRCSLLISNDSAPMHLAVAVRTPVVALFGATVPRFGFAPRGQHDVVAEVNGLACRPCSIHGGDKCPIKTFVCMKDLKPEIVYAKVQTVLGTLQSEE